MEVPRNNYVKLIYRMVKKIKVVEMNTSNPEAPDGVQEQPITQAEMPMQENIPEPITQVQEPVITQEEEPVANPQAQSQAEPKARKPRQPRQPKEPKPPKEQKLVREPRVKKVKDPPQSESDSIDTEEMVEVIKNHRAKKKQPAPEPPQEPTSPPPAPPATKEEKINCPDCGKVMSAKSLKYAHAKNCRAKPPANQQQPRADFMLNAIEADKKRQIADIEEHPISVLLAAERAVRMGQRRQRIETLLSNAF
jgi:hypothetical protein